MPKKHKKLGQIATGAHFWAVRKRLFLYTYGYEREAIISL